MPTDVPIPGLWLTIAGVYAVMSLVTIAAFVIDKRRAERGAWRIRERTLFSLAICCGWPGAVLAMKLARHKTRKPLFRFGIPAIALLHAAALVGLVLIVGGWVSPSR